MDRDFIKKIVDEELARPEVKDAMHPRSWIGRFSSHPFVLTVIGFLFTFLISTTIESRLSDRRNEIARIDAQIEGIASEADAQRESLDQIVESAQRRVVAGDLLRSALKRNASEEIGPRKKHYDAEFSDWNVYLRKNLNLLSSISNGANEYRKAIEGHVQNEFRQIDQCLTAAYDMRKGRKRPSGNCLLDKSAKKESWVDKVEWQKFKNISFSIEECMAEIHKVAKEEIRAQQVHAESIERQKAESMRKIGLMFTKTMPPEPPQVNLSSVSKFCVSKPSSHASHPGG